jgi:nucleotide-binding universal stress UspA family protein
VYRSIVVGTDGSESAARAVRRAVELGKAHGARLLLVTAVEPISPARIQRELQEVPEDLRFRVNLARETEEILGRAAAEAAAEGVEAETHPMEGDPAVVVKTT